MAILKIWDAEAQIFKSVPQIKGDKGDPGTIPGLTGDVTLYVSTTGNDTTGNGSAGSPYKTMAKALSMIPKNLNRYNATVQVAAGTYSEDVLITGFHSGYIALIGAAALADTHTVNSIWVDYCNTYVTVQGFRLVNTAGDAVTVGVTKFADLKYLKSVVSAISKNGIYFSSSGGGVYGCLMSNRQTALVADEMSNVLSCDWSAGSGNAVGIGVNGGIVLKSGTQPQGTTAEAKTLGGQITS